MVKKQFNTTRKVKALTKMFPSVTFLILVAATSICSTKKYLKATALVIPVDPFIFI
jgi:hypothetical protein